MIHAEQLRREGLHGGILETRFARKLADESRTDNTLADDSDLFFAVGPNQIWIFRAMLWPNSTSNTPDFKVAISSPTGTTGLFQGPGLNTSATATSGVHTSGANIALDGTAVLSYGCVGSFGVPSSVFGYGAAIIGAVGGVIRVRWAQNTTSPTATVLSANSYLIGYRLR